ncbi:MAG: 30S ribosomal protein S1 [Thermaerobacter sp.]|nr:30S ribosomal protein S1 [Thermaerobacter sp.]
MAMGTESDERIDRDRRAEEQPRHDEPAAGADEASTDQEALEQSMGMHAGGDVRPGQTVTGTVVQISGDTVLVDVGAKSEGIIHLHDLSHRRADRPEELVAIGDRVTVLVLGWEGDEGMLRLSKRRADEALAWARLEDALKTGEVLEPDVSEVVRGGLVVDVGMRGFVPSSHVAKGFVNDLQPFLGQKIRVRVIELDRSKRRAILSRKVVLDEEGKSKREELWNSIEEGQVREGVVKSLTDFGAFVDMGGTDGLLHISEMSWGRIQHPSELLSVGDAVKVKVLRLDRDRQKISLGLRQVSPNPWEVVEERYPDGAILEGKVVRIASFGVFVELEPGVDGLVHVSQLADHRVESPGDVVKVGDIIRVKVLYVDPQQKRISLSKRDADLEDAERAREEAPAAEEPSDDEAEQTGSGKHMTAYHAGNWDDEKPS